MQILGASSEEEMVGLFLRSEINSTRWCPNLLEILAGLGCPVELLEKPDIAQAEHNMLRAAVLTRFRGYGENRALFANYPHGVDWHWVLLDRAELCRTKYVDYSYWNEITGGTRRPTDAVATIRNGIEVYRVSNQGFWEGVKAICNGAVFPEPILVAPAPTGDLVILEGHRRLTIYALAGNAAPQSIRALLGLSPEFMSWL